MKCELCHNAEARRAIVREDVDGEDNELYVCEACAKAERQRRQRKSSRTRKMTGLPPGVEVSVTEISGMPFEDGQPPPIVGALLNAFHDIVSGFEKAPTLEQNASSENQIAWKELSADCVEEEYRMCDAFHLEGLFLIGELEAVRRALHALDMDIVGIGPEELKDPGHTFRLRYAGSEEAAKRVAAALVREERNARVRLYEEFPRVYGDSLCRALAVLKNCRLLSSSEFLDLLSPLRLAAKERMLDGLTFRQVETMIKGIDLSAKEMALEQHERDRIDANRADKVNRRFEDVVLNERAEERFL